MAQVLAERKAVVKDLGHLFHENIGSRYSRNVLSCSRVA